ncbi:mediator of RNA polymerase II transcription subunit 15-like [Phlebotomus argentipes]|uniref:mediator of RNA polymerase II transcription subunit 15-like n=1 Tax=Phlebotomus argentipes TaxID=94469 RepID=UPI002892A1BC|nr:mediator of RNA polymerase II transcription subunit 15-like [Phlebotomus argentipes]
MAFDRRASTSGLPDMNSTAREMSFSSTVVCFVFFLQFSLSFHMTCPEATPEDNSWRTPSFRQAVTAKINEVIQTSGIRTSSSSIEMENRVYAKARNKHEYLGLAARLILHIREMNK